MPSSSVSASSGSVPSATSSPSVRPSSSVSASSGSVPIATSSPSARPSPSVSAMTRSVPMTVSSASASPSPSPSTKSAPVMPANLTIAMSSLNGPKNDRDPAATTLPSRSMAASLAASK